MSTLEKIKRLLAILVSIFTLNATVELKAQVKGGDSLVIEKLKFIQTSLRAGQNGSRRWWNGWLIGYTAATGIQGTIGIISKNISTRQDMLLGAGTTLLGALSQVATPMPSSVESEILENIPENTVEERSVKLKQAEDMLRECALREKTGRSWQIHAISSMVNLGSGMVTWIAFKRTLWEGIENFALNTVITEAQIWSQPTRALKNYTKYNQQYGEDFFIKNQPSIAWYVLVTPGKVGIRIVF